MNSSTVPYQEIGKLKYQLDWLKKRWDIPIAEKLLLIENDNGRLSIREQCDLLGISRSNYYYERKPTITEEF